MVPTRGGRPARPQHACHDPPLRQQAILQWDDENSVRRPPHLDSIGRHARTKQRVRRLQSSLLARTESGVQPHAPRVRPTRGALSSSARLHAMATAFADQVSACYVPVFIFCATESGLTSARLHHEGWPSVIHCNSHQIRSLILRPDHRWVRRNSSHRTAGLYIYHQWKYLAPQHYGHLHSNIGRFQAARGTLCRR